MDLAEDVYGLIRMLPVEEKFSLADQMRRAVLYRLILQKDKVGKVIRNLYIFYILRAVPLLN